MYCSSVFRSRIVSFRAYAVHVKGTHSAAGQGHPQRPGGQGHVQSAGGQRPLHKAGALPAGPAGQGGRGTPKGKEGREILAGRGDRGTPKGVDLCMTLQQTASACLFCLRWLLSGRAQAA